MINFVFPYSALIVILPYGDQIVTLVTITVWIRLSICGVIPDVGVLGIR